MSDLLWILFNFVFSIILIVFAWSAKSDFGGNFIGFDFTWIKELFIRKRKVKEVLSGK